MVTTRIKAAKGRALTSHVVKTNHIIEETNLDDWLSNYPDCEWSHLEILREWDMTFEPSQDELIQRFGGELLAPHFAPAEEFWSKTREEVLTKWICDEVLRVCNNDNKRSANPRFNLCVDGDADIEDRDEKIAEAKDFIKDFQSGKDKCRRGQQIRNVRVPRVDRARRYPGFVRDAHIIESNHATIFLHSPGSQTELHSDCGQGGAMSFGVKLWAFFPPTTGNMKLMRQYLALLGENTDDDCATKEFWRENPLEKGVWLIQNPGELLFTPSAAPHAVFTFTWAPFVTAHVDTAVTFVRNLRFLETFLAYPPHRDIERVHILLNQITSERVGNQTFVKLRVEVAELWPKVEDAVRETASARDWKKVKAALRKMFDGVSPDHLPGCGALEERDNVKVRKEVSKRKAIEAEIEEPTICPRRKILRRRV